MNKPVVEGRVLEKIRKCLALSKSSNEHEAAAALRQAQKLMELHGVSEVGLAADSIAESKFKSKTSISRPKFWEASLIKTVAGAFGCKMYWVPHRSREGSQNYFGEYTLVGPKTQLELAVYTCAVMQRKLTAARGAYLKTLADKGLDRKQLTQYGDGFAHGWVEAVGKTIHDFANPEAVAQAVALWIEGKCRSKVKQQTRGVTASGVEAGRAAGKGASIYRPMNTREQLRLGEH